MEADEETGERAHLLDHTGLHLHNTTLRGERQSSTWGAKVKVNGVQVQLSLPFWKQMKSKQHLDQQGAFADAAGVQTLLRNITVEARPGRLLAILGPSGLHTTTWLIPVCHYVSPFVQTTSPYP